MLKTFQGPLTFQRLCGTVRADSLLKTSSHTLLSGPEQWLASLSQEMNEYSTVFRCTMIWKLLTVRHRFTDNYSVCALTRFINTNSITTSARLPACCDHLHVQRMKDSAATFTSTPKHERKPRSVSSTMHRHKNSTAHFTESCALTLQIKVLRRFRPQQHKTQVTRVVMEVPTMSVILLWGNKSRGSRVFSQLSSPSSPQSSLFPLLCWRGAPRREGSTDKEQERVRRRLSPLFLPLFLLHLLPFSQEIHLSV